VISTPQASALVALSLALGGCSSVGDFCTRDSQCGPGLRCSIPASASRGVCVYAESTADSSRRREAGADHLADRRVETGAEAGVEAGAEAGPDLEVPIDARPTEPPGREAGPKDQRPPDSLPKLQ
jgi:hypothetical protein